MNSRPRGMWRNACLSGVRAAAQNAPAGIALILAITLLVISYYRVPAVTSVLNPIMEVKLRYGVLFPFVVSGLAGGVMSEIYIVAVFQRGRLSRHNVWTAFGKFLIFGIGSAIVGYFYELQAFIFGSELKWQTVCVKVFTDQFIFNPLWAGPFQAATFFLMTSGFSREHMREIFSVRFYATQVVPVLVTTWFLWIPLTLCIYSLPTALQLPVAIMSNAFWSLLLTSLTKMAGGRDARDEAIRPPDFGS